ncbi:MAG TPA: hypothetical protein PKY25_02845 [Bacilli bacterium]|nr:hypothetical protein [Bacilli bacterium]
MYNNEVYRLEGLYLFPYFNGEEIEYKIMLLQKSEHTLSESNRDRYFDTYRVISSDKIITSDYEFCSEPALKKAVVCYYFENPKYNLRSAHNRRLSNYVKNTVPSILTNKQVLDLEETINLDKKKYITEEQILEDEEKFSYQKVKPLAKSINIS